MDNVTHSFFCVEYAIFSSSFYLFNCFELEQKGNPPHDVLAFKKANSILHC